jgi:hypothetical protein
MLALVKMGHLLGHVHVADLAFAEVRFSRRCPGLRSCIQAVLDSAEVGALGGDLVDGTVHGVDGGRGVLLETTLTQETPNSWSPFWSM